MGIVFDENDEKNVEENLKNKEYNKIRISFKQKMNDIMNFYSIAMVLTDFVEYVRKTMNNMRTFKMQLRESKIEELEYLDYIINQWQNNNNIGEILNKTKSNFPALNDININQYSLENIFNSLIYEKYVMNFGKNFSSKDLSGYKLFLRSVDSSYYIVLIDIAYSKDKMEVLEINGNVCKNLPMNILNGIYSSIKNIVS